MKKFVTVLLCVLIILFFAGFNYLLWDRENKAESIKSLELSGESKDSYINFLTSEKKRIEVEYENLRNENEALGESLAAANTQVEDMARENEELESMLAQSNELLELLLTQVDKLLLRQKVIYYVECINNREYEKAYDIRHNHGLDYAQPPTLEEFINRFESNIESINMEYIGYMEGYSGLESGMYAFNARLNARLKEGAGERGCEFVPGVNVRIFIVGFDRQLKEWVIADILQTAS